MNKDSWNIIFNKANDATLMSMKDLNEKILYLQTEREKRRHEKYGEFLESLDDTSLIASFYRNFTCLYEHEASERISMDGISIFILGNNENDITIYEKDQEIKWDNEKSLKCNKEDFLKVLQYMEWLADGNKD